MGNLEAFEAEVELDTDAIEPTNHSMGLKCVIFVVTFLALLWIIERYREQPFISFYFLLVLLLTFPLTVYSGGHWSLIVKDIIIAIAFVGFSLWRISCISEDNFKEYYERYKVNKWVYHKMRRIMSHDVMEWFCAIALAINMLWAVAIDAYVGSYYNAACALILIITIPLPSSLSEHAPGYSVVGRDKTADLAAMDFHWFWVCHTSVHDINVRFTQIQIQIGIGHIVLSLLTLICMVVLVGLIRCHYILRVTSYLSSCTRWTSPCMLIGADRETIFFEYLLYLYIDMTFDEVNLPQLQLPFHCR